MRKSFGVILFASLLATSACGITDPLHVNREGPSVAWTADSLEESIMSTDTTNTLTGVAMTFVSASCVAGEVDTAGVGIYQCTVRQLGEPKPATWRIETTTDAWAAGGVPLDAS